MNSNTPVVHLVVVRTVFIRLAVCNPMIFIRRAPSAENWGLKFASLINMVLQCNQNQANWPASQPAGSQSACQPARGSEKECLYWPFERKGRSAQSIKPKEL